MTKKKFHTEFKFVYIYDLILMFESEVNKYIKWSSYASYRKMSNWKNMLITEKCVMLLIHYNFFYDYMFHWMRINQNHIKKYNFFKSVVNGT